MSDLEARELTLIREAGGDHLDLPFWQGCRRGEFLVHCCESCGRKYWPASRCTEHGGRAMSWVRASGRGTVHTFTIVHHVYAQQWADKVPYCVAVVELEEGPLFHTNIVGCPLEAVRVGMSVVVRFDADSRGLVLPRFVPA